MASAQFSLKERDKKRWLKDRLVRFSVTCGGVSVLAALVLIFVYLAMVILPVFSDTGLETAQVVKTVGVEEPIALSVDEYGQHAFTIEKSGLVQFWDLDSQKKHSYFERSVVTNPIAFSRNTPSENWFAFADGASNMTFFYPEYSAPVLQKGTETEPKIEQITLPEPFLHDEPANGAVIEQFAFSKSGRDITVIAQLTDQRVLVKWYQSDLAGAVYF